MKVQDILDALSSSEIVEEIKVLVLVLEPGRQALRAVATLEVILRVVFTLALGSPVLMVKVGRRKRYPCDFL